LHSIPAAFLNKRQIRKHKEKDQRVTKWATATFDKNEELKKLMMLGTEDQEKDIVNIYTPLEAIEEIKNQSIHKVDESIDICVKLGIDPVKSDQQIRGTIVLPGGIGREVKIAVFTSKDNIELAKNTQADMIIDLVRISEITAENLDFQKLVATKDVINLLKPYGRTIGPLGLMPNIKSGTLVETQDLQETIKILKAGRIEVKNDVFGIVHACIGKRKFEKERLLENLKTIAEFLKQLKPEKARGEYFKW
jgi:large subunit ribosomal protein L1